MRIGELAEVTGVTPKTLRYYESEGLLPEPGRTAGGYRDYGPEAPTRVAFVRQAQAAGLTLRQIGKVLAVRDGGAAPCGHVSEFVDTRLAEVEQRLRELRGVRRQLLELRARLETLDPADCTPDSICAAVRA